MAQELKRHGKAFPPVEVAGIVPPRPEGAEPWQSEAAPKDGFHVLRHTYASKMLEAGESV
ncbi:hypothetical protein ACWGGS_09305 [Streptomyces decoyicus]